MQLRYEVKLAEIINLDFLRSLKFTKFDNEQKGLNGGVYRMYNAKGKIIYVGKSSNLHVRLHNHLAFKNHTAYFMHEVTSIEWYTESNPIFETLLEAILIAYHRPKYNDEVKDANKLKKK